MSDRGEDRPAALAPVLVASRIRIVSAAISSVRSGGSSTNRSGSDAYRHATAYGCTTVDATVINARASNAGATGAATICEGVS